MALQDDLTGVRDDLREATDELVAKLADLEEQVRNGTVDPATVTELQNLASGLANVVPDAPAEPPVEEPPVQEPPVEEPPVEEPPVFPGDEDPNLP